MRLLASHTIRHATGQGFIRLYQGDLSAIPPAEAVDLLVVSAFPGDYVPTPTSLIGALRRRGVSVAALAKDPEADLREISGCWVSRDLAASHPDAGFRRLLCFEPLTRGAPPEVVGDIFRALVPYTLGDAAVRSLAVPLLAAGDQAFDAEEMLRALHGAAAGWLGRGLPLETIKIVVSHVDEAERMRMAFQALAPPVRHAGFVDVAAAGGAAREPYDFFVSYAREDEAEVRVLVEALAAHRPGLRVFLDRVEIDPGEAWQTEIDEALEDCRKVVAVYSPAYFGSKVCMEEFNMARLRHRESDHGVIIPIYLRTADLRLYHRSLNYVDCREGDVGRVRACGGSLVAALLAGSGEQAIG